MSLQLTLDNSTAGSPWMLTVVVLMMLIIDFTGILCCMSSEMFDWQIA